MAWVRLDDSFADHPKIEALSDRAHRAFIWGLCYASRHLTDGFLPLGAVAARWAARIRNELAQASLWLETEGGYLVHDYLDYNPSRERTLSEREAARVRMAGRRSSPEPSSDDKANSSRTSASPYPSPNPGDSKLEPVALGSTLLDLSSPQAAQIAGPPKPNGVSDTQWHLLRKLAANQPAWVENMDWSGFNLQNRKFSRAVVSTALQHLLEAPPDDVQKPLALLVAMCQGIERDAKDAAK